MNANEAVKYLIDNNEILILASADAAAKPWATPLGYTFDGKCFYWVSSKVTRHSVNVRNNQLAAISIFGEVPSGGLDGAYFEVSVEELNDRVEIDAALESYAKLEQPDRWKIHSTDDLMGDATWRIYRAQVLKAFKRADAVDEESGQSVTVREEVEL